MGRMNANQRLGRNADGTTRPGAAPARHRDFGAACWAEAVARGISAMLAPAATIPPILIRSRTYR